MKKVISLVLVFSFVSAFCACGNLKKGALSKEEMLAQAVEIDNLFDALDENPVKANEKYVGNIYLITGSVTNISSDKINIGAYSVPLSKEEILELDNEQRVTVVGKIESISWENGETHGVYLSNSYLVTGYYDTKGCLQEINNSYKPAWNFLTPENNICKLVYFADGVDPSSLESYNVTIHSKIRMEYTAGVTIPVFYDATIID